MQNEKYGEEMNDNLGVVYSEVVASVTPVRIKTGKSLVTLKDRAVLNVRLSKQGMGNGGLEYNINEKLVAVDIEYPASEGACNKTGKSLVTLKDRAELNIRLSKQDTERISPQPHWKYEE